MTSLIVRGVSYFASVSSVPVAFQKKINTKCKNRRIKRTKQSLQHTTQSTLSLTTRVKLITALFTRGNWHLVVLSSLSQVVSTLCTGSICTSLWCFEHEEALLLLQWSCRRPLWRWTEATWGGDPQPCHCVVPLQNITPPSPQPP